ncbi:putative glycosyltransferase EpsJ [Candidatus Brocadiaceae bacterium B188]|nr:glycosyltransferase family 2 protein [Candidatus Brocadia sapporoensis]QQR66153.1 MAG: glycosyltransferase family 2 protein [Candidatus Brocadia sp.]RZV56539.1 MAG: glycosyltransferase family 2 protein [Candidatus Brocadia sp. BROELEC01]TWU53083.1 putative glycosyltransferase EpsJ [Candidatus Brocadiaceae bacterium B188]
MKVDRITLLGSPHKNSCNPLVSVVIPAYNEEQYLSGTLQSVINQDFQNFELIVVNNNSTDKTAEIAENFGANIIFEPRQGVGFARQRGFMEAKGSIIATTDADTILPSNWLSRIVDKFEKDENLVAFGGLYTLYSGPLSARLTFSYFAHPAWALDKFFSGGWGLPGVNFAVRKDAFLKVGGFKTELSIGEDAEISRRLRKTGKVLLDPSFLVKTSGRRYRSGLIVGFMTYLPNGITRILFNKHKFLKLPAIRSERPLLPRLLARFIFVLIIITFSFFYFSHYCPLRAGLKRPNFIINKIKAKQTRMKSS